MTQAWSAGSLSVVVPLYNEEANVEPLLSGILDVVRGLGIPSELIVVDDGSSDGTLDALGELAPANPEVVVVALSRNYGQTQALQAGFDRARGEAIVTMDGDLQNDPRDIPRLLEELAGGADVVSGWRRQRQDALVVRKVPSWAANWLIRRSTGVPIHDQGCSLKAYRRPVVRSLDLYGDMHRFIGVLTMPLSTRIAEIEVRHHPRVAGESKYGLSRILKVLADLFTIQTITRFRERPLHWFTLLASPFLLAALIIGVVLLVVAPGPVLSAVFLITVTSFVACALFGLLANWIIEGAARERPFATFREWDTQA